MQVIPRIFLILLISNMARVSGAEINTSLLAPTNTIGDTYLRILSELTYNIWGGFLEGFYSGEQHLVRSDCLGEDSQRYLRHTLLLVESTNKRSFFFNLAKVIRNIVYLVRDMRQHCHINVLIDDMVDFCEDHCEGKKIMTRLTVNFSTLSKIYSEMISIIYDTDPDTMPDEYKLLNDLGNKGGEFTRIAIGFIS
jgi:hypothetical protein